MFVSFGLSATKLDIKIPELFIDIFVPHNDGSTPELFPMIGFPEPYTRAKVLVTV